MIFILNHFCPISLIILASREGVKISPSQLISMRVRKVNSYLVVETAIRLHKSGIDIDISNLECHILSGGNLAKVANVLIAAKKDNRELTFNQVCALDLMGKL
jgi:uncharacterized protein YqfA (UPF0365 family)